MGNSWAAIRHQRQRPCALAAGRSRLAGRRSMMGSLPSRTPPYQRVESQSRAGASRLFPRGFRLARLSETLDRHRREGQQQITEKHVTVNAYQAVVADTVAGSEVGRGELPRLINTGCGGGIR